MILEKSIIPENATIIDSKVREQHNICTALDSLSQRTINTLRDHSTTLNIPSEQICPNPLGKYLKYVRLFIIFNRLSQQNVTYRLALCLLGNFTCILSSAAFLCPSR